MATMEEHALNMTLYYFKSNGDIYSYASGIQDMTIFGAHEADYSLMLTYVIVPKDEYVMESIHQFYVDIETTQLKLRAGASRLRNYL